MVWSKARGWIGFRSGIPGIALFLIVALSVLLFATPAAFAAGGSCPTGANYVNPSNPFGSLVTLSSLGVTSCYYFSKSAGSDSANGTSESAPQQHLPGMTDYTGSITPAAGQGFILKGGDTWVAADLGVVWLWGGTSASPIYIGVDPTWYSGSSWTRPVFTCQYTSCASTFSSAQFNLPHYVVINTSNVTVDDIEFTGLISNSSGGGPAYGVTQMQNDIIERIYAHGWQVAAGATTDTQSCFQFANNNNPPYSSAGSGLLLSVIDGADQTPFNGLFSMQAIAGNPAFIIGSIIQNVTNGFQGTSTNVHDNFWGPVLQSYNPGAHNNAMHLFNSANGDTSQFVYNNLFTGTLVAGGTVKMWLDENMTASTHGYAFDNVMYNNTAGNYINIFGHGGTYGQWDIFNNTAECGTDGAQGQCAATCPTCVGTVRSQNNHWITSSSPGLQCGASSTCSATTDLTQSVATAKGQGYTSGSNYAFQPTSSSGGTVGAGTDIQSLCTSINGLDTAAGAACQNDTGYACTYNTTNHTTSCPLRTRNARPNSAAWDIGGFQFGLGPNPPTGLTATVQ
jgi:hypothetical protein